MSVERREYNTILGIRVSAIVEMAVFFVVALLIDSIFGAGNRFWDIEPHPFWLIIIAVAVQYGVNEGLIAALLATAVYLIGNMPGRIDGQDIFDYIYMIALNPVMWLPVAVIIGEIRQRHIRERDHLLDELEETADRETTISEAYSTVKSRKEQLEVQVAGELTSSVQAYQAAKAMEARDPRAVMEGVENLVVSILNPEKFSLYIFHDNKLSTTMTHGWGGEDNFRQEFDAHSRIYSEVMGSHTILCIANEDHETLLEGQGMLAGPVLDPDSGAVIGMLKIEKIAFVNLSLATIETFKSLCEWVGASMVLARNYQTAKQDSVVNPENNLMTSNFFKRQREYLTHLAKRVDCDLSMLVIKITDAQQMEEEARVALARELSQAVNKELRMIDLAFDYQENAEEFSILLPATDKKGADIVKNKIADDLTKRLARSDHGSNFTYMVQALHEAA